MDPHASRLVHPVTEYSAKQGSSGFPNEHWSGMDAAILLLALKQGTRSLEGYITNIWLWLMAQIYRTVC